MQGNQRQALQYAYLAGLLDGEGCLRIGKDNVTPSIRRQGHLNPKYCASISIHMTERKPLDFFRSVFPKGHLVYEGVRENRPNQRPTFCWRTSCREQIIHVIECLRPYFLVKDKQADLLLEYCKIFKCMYSMRKKGQEKEREHEIQRREELYQQMKKLNAVGAAATTNPESVREYKVIV